MNIQTINMNPNQIGLDSSNRLRVSELTTLHDGKIINNDNIFIYSNTGTGTGIYSNNKYNMSVTSGQYFIRQTQRYFPYFAGKSQLIELTFDNFQIQTNVIKRIGYFSSISAATYNTNLDGFWLENDGITYRIKASRLGLETLNIPFTSWLGYNELQSYNWSNFTIILFDFLWLGGAILRLFIKTNNGFVLAHITNYSGSQKDTFIASPHQPVRYDIYSSTGTGSLRYICNQVSTEGSNNECGYSKGINTGSSGIITATIGTKYPLKGIRKGPTNRDNIIKLEDLSIYVSSANDILLWTLEINPTLSAPLTWTDIPNCFCQEVSGNGTITVTVSGNVILSGYVSQSSAINGRLLKENFLSYLGCDINNTMNEYILCVTPVTAGVTSYANINYNTL